LFVSLDALSDRDALASLRAGLVRHGKAVHVVLPEVDGLPVRAEIRRIDGRTCLSLSAFRDSPLERFVRRLSNVVLASFLLLLSSPVMAVVALLVRLRMGGPVVFAQERLGKGGVPFRLFKFRSMVADAETVLRRDPGLWDRYVASDFKLPPEEDPRITPLGRFLRKTSLDELPQLWNVLRGEMNLVGPRAIVPEELREYGDFDRMFLRVRPGLTGLWQVSGRSAIGYPERARIELHYVGTRSLVGDLKILLRTLPAVLLRRGAV